MATHATTATIVKVEAAFKEFFGQVSDAEFTTFFEEKFLVPLNSTLDGDEKVPAETIRHQRQQTNKIRNILLTNRKK